MKRFVPGQWNERHLITCWLWIVICFSHSNCSPAAQIEKSPGISLSDYRTYDWIRKDSLSRKLELLDRNVKGAVDRQMEKLGYRENDSLPDLLLDYDVLVERSTHMDTEPYYGGFYFRSFFNPYSGRWATIYFPSQFMWGQSYHVPVLEGTITLTVIDTKTDRTIWQGWSSEWVNSRILTAREIDDIVTAIMRKFK